MKNNDPKQNPWEDHKLYTPTVPDANAVGRHRAQTVTRPVINPQVKGPCT